MASETPPSEHLGGDARVELASNRTSMSFDRTRMSSDRTLMACGRARLAGMSAKA